MISVHLGPVFLFENLAKRLVLFLFSVYSVVFAWFFDHRIHGIHGRIPILLILFADAPDPYFRTRWLVPPQQTKRKTGGTSPRVRLVLYLWIHVGLEEGFLGLDGADEDEFVVGAEHLGWLKMDEVGVLAVDFTLYGDNAATGAFTDLRLN